MKIPFSFNPLGVSKDSGGGMPTSGLVFYAPLVDVDEIQAVTGQGITKQGNISLYTSNANKNGINCIHSTNATTTNFWQFQDTNLPSGNSVRTTSVWVCGMNNCTNRVNENGWNLFKYGSQDAVRNAWYRLYPYMVDKAYQDYKWYNTWPNSETLIKDVWCNIISTFDGSTIKIYCNGVQVASTNATFETTVGSGSSLNIFGDNWDNYFTGYMTAFRIYDRVLSDEEIALLATEFTPHYQITASDLSFSLYQKNESYSISYSSPGGQPTFEIIEGELPSTISFNTSTGQFYGKGLTDADHVYNLKVRLTAANSDPATCNVTIYTYKTARISLSSQTFSFISNKAENFAISYTSDEAVTFVIESGTMPAGMTLSSGRFFSNGQNSSADNQQVVVRATSANNQTGVTATMTLVMQMNAIVCNAQTFKFYTAQGAKTKAVKYSGSLNPVSDAVFSMTGTLPAGVTWDATTGSFTSDGTQSTDETASVSVTVSSANGTSTAATATVTIEVSTEDIVDPIIEDGLTLFIPCENDWSAQQGVALNSVGTEEPTSTTNDGKKCIYFNGNTILANQDDSYWNLSADRGEAITMCFWFKADLTNITGDETFICQIGNGNGYSDSGCAVFKNDTNIIQQTEFGHWDNDILTNDLSGWHFYAMQFNGSYGGLETYVDGVKKDGQSRNYPICKSRTVAIGKFLITYNPLAFSSQRTNEGWYTRIRLYNRLLTDSEIQTLAAEFA